MTCRLCRTSSRKLTWTGYFIRLYSIATDALVTLKWLNLITTVDFIMVVYTFTSVLMASWITLWSCQQTGTFIITRGDSHIKVTEMLVVSLWGVLNCRFWSHLGCLELTVTIFAHSGIAYSTVHNEIHKKCPDSNQTEISLRNLFKLEPTPTMVSLSGLISIFRQASPHFYIGIPRPDLIIAQEKVTCLD